MFKREGLSCEQGIGEAGTGQEGITENKRIAILGGLMINML